MDRNRKRLLIVVLVLVFSLSVLLGAERGTEAQTSGMPTPADALEAALNDYTDYTSQTIAWSVGEVHLDGGYAYAIAEAENSASSEQGYLLLLAQQDAAGNWYAVAPKVTAAKLYNEWLNKMPGALLSAFDKSFYYQYSAEELNLLDDRAATLHHFPWPIGRNARVTQKDGDYHENQIDFVMRDTNDVYASKPGVVVYVKEVSSVGGCDIALWEYANMVVVQHSATEYTWYLHLVKDSVPVKVGDLIGYGTKIGEQGNTGFACGTTGIHLHYMSSTAIPAVWPSSTTPSIAPWPPGGTIVPVDFIESSWASLTVGSIYLSQNAPPYSSCTVDPTSAGFYSNTYCSGPIATSSTAGLLTLTGTDQADNIESLDLPAGWSVALYADENELGPTACFSALDQMLWDNQFTDGNVVANQTTWLRVYTSTGCPYPDALGIKFLEGVNFTGTPLWGMVGERTTNGPAHVAGSIYLPDGYTATLYDQDNLAGNSLCIEGSVLNMAEYAWDGRVIESVKLEFGGFCQPPSSDVARPLLDSPASNADVWGPGAPEFCWSVPAGNEGLTYNAVVYNDTASYQSGWTADTCWTADAMDGLYGAYSWHVQARNTAGEVGDWSATHTFLYQQDLGTPIAAILTPVENGNVVRPRANISVDAVDLESGVTRVYFFGWYDNGSGVYDWYYLGEDVDGQDGWQWTWNLLPVVSPDVSTYIYAEDRVGNFGFDIVSGVYLSDTQTTDGGFAMRENERLEPAVIPESGPALELIPGYVPPVVEAPPAAATIPESENNYGGGPAQPSGRAASVVLPAVSGARQPEAGDVLYGPTAPELCWQAVQSGQGMEYRVQVQGEHQIVSPWVSGTCWTASGLEGQTGTFDWQVQARSADGTTSLWSERYAFTVLTDGQTPEVRLLSPQLGGKVVDKLFVEVEAYDLESGVQQVYFLAWYDAGDGNQWHTIGSMQPIGGDEVYQFIWDVTDIPRQEIQLWVYVGDAAGNFGYARVESVWLGDAPIESTPRYPRSMPETGSHP